MRCLCRERETFHLPPHNIFTRVQMCKHVVIIVMFFFSSFYIGYNTMRKWIHASIFSFKKPENLALKSKVFSPPEVLNLNAVFETKRPGKCKFYSVLNQLLKSDMFRGCISKGNAVKENILIKMKIGVDHHKEIVKLRGLVSRNLFAIKLKCIVWFLIHEKKKHFVSVCFWSGHCWRW